MHLSGNLESFLAVEFDDVTTRNTTAYCFWRTLYMHGYNFTYTIRTD